MYSRKEIWRISLPILVSLFVQNLINITDTAFMGRVGQVELGASALAGVLYLAFYMVTFGFSTGAQILMARRNGEAKYGTLGPIMGQGILFLEIFSIILIFASLIGTPQMLKVLISSTAVCQAGEDYMQYRIFGLLFTSIGVMFRAFFVAVEHLGELPLAISNIIRSTSTLLFMPVNAFGATACTLVSNAMGARRADDVIPIARRIVKMCYAIVLPLIALLCLAPHWILLIYTYDSSLIAECTHSVYVMSSFYLIALPGNILFQSVSGTGDTRTAFLIEMITIVFYTLTIYWIIVALRVDIAFCWTVEYVYWGFKLFLSFLFFKKMNWKVKKI